MEFGLKRCWTLTVGRANVKAEGLKTQQGDIKELNENDTYRYFRFMVPCITYQYSINQHDAAGQ